MKKCGHCDKLKAVDEFNKRMSSYDGLQPTCRECNRSRSRKYYKDNGEKHKKAVYVRSAKQRQINREYVHDYLLHHPCVMCPETDPVVLEFDHLRDKKNSICKMVVNGNSIETIKKEIEKCQVLCANCHRRKTAKQFGWKMYN